jgi:hypothetical protein
VPKINGNNAGTTGNLIINISNGIEESMPQREKGRGKN